MDFPDFCEELREKSKAIHAKSDKLVQLKLAVALTNIKLYQQVICDFHSVFKAIEDGVNKNISHPYLVYLWQSDFSRTKLIENDLNFFAGLGWKNIVHPSSQALQYTSHINDIAQNEPELLVAYIHTMYLAIFSGGFIIRGIVKKTLGISGAEGLEMFEVPGGTTRQKIKKHIKDTINDLDIDRTTKDRIVQEKIDIFRRNNLIVGALEPSLSSFTRILKFIAFVFVAAFCFYYVTSRSTDGSY